ncbi:MAG: PAS domain S-box protein [Thermoplasmata archaeon]|nr:PAS domain S-box protein [Thermoplasmata archaeon]
MYEAITRKVDDALCIVQDDIIKFVNSKALSLSGYKKEEIIEKPFSNLFPQSEREELLREYKKWKKKGGIYEMTMQRKDGDKFSAQITVIPMEYEGKTAQCVLIRDVTEKKREEEKYRLLVENSTDGIFLAIGFKPVYANPAFLKIIGAKSFEEIKNKNLLKFLHPEDRKEIKEDIKRAASGKISIKNYELRFRRLDGKEVVVELSLSKVVYDGKPHALGVVKDITERKKLEEALKEERELFVGGPVVVFKWKAGEEKIPVEYVSPNIKTVFGYSMEDMLSGKISYDDIIHPEDVERVKEEVMAYRKKGVTHFEQEYRIIDAEGRIRWIHDFTVVKRDKKGKITHYHGYIVDITKRKRIEEKLKKEREQFISILECIDQPIYVVDIETHEILFANAALRKIFGEDIVGKICYKALQNRDSPCDFCTNEKITGKNFGKVYIWEFQNRVNKRWYRCIDRAMIWPDGRIVRMEIAIDITDRVKAEERIRKALEKEREFKLRTAHYFFNPIAIAKGYLSLAIEEGDGKEKIEKAIHAIERVEKVIKNITRRGEIVE